MSNPSSESPVLTVVIPVRDRSALVRGVLDCIEAALRHSSFNVTVVDNGSVDDTASVVEQRLAAMRVTAPGSRLTLLSEPRPGACAARNTGLRSVDTPFVMFFDSDDLFDSTLPARIAQCAADHPGADLIGWEVAYTDGSPLPPTSRCMLRGHHLMHGSLSTQRYAVRTSLVRRIGGWDETLPVWNDLELGMRLLLASPAMVMLSGAPPVRILRHDASITGRRFSDRPGERERSLDAIWQDCLDAGRPDLLPLVDARRLILAAIYRSEGSGSAALALRRRVVRQPRPLRQRLALALVWRVQCLLGRGGSAVALTLC